MLPILPTFRFADVGGTASVLFYQPPHWPLSATWFGPFVLGKHLFKSPAAGTTPIIVQAAASQTASVMESQTSAGDIRARISKDCEFTNSGAAGVGTGNECFGIQAGLSLEAGASNNNLFGGAAGASITTGDFNSCFGSSAGNAITTGSNNLCMGRSADVTGGSTSDATVIGTSANVSGQYGTAIGTQASAVTLSVCIGLNASAAHSNTCVLGRLATSAASGEHVWGGNDSDPSYVLMRASSTSQRSLAALRSTWVTSTDASRLSRFTLTAFDFNAEREVFRGEADGTNGITAIGGAVTADTRSTIYGTALGSKVLRLTTAATNDDPTYDVRQNRVATTDATVTTLDTIAITASKTYLIEARVVARRTGGAAGTTDDGAAYIRRAMVTTKAGTVTINAVQDDLTQEDQAGWDCTFDVSTTNIRIRVTGAADNNVTWHSTTTLQEVGS